MDFVYSVSSLGGGGGSGSVTEVDTGTGLTGGPITTTGTVSLADIGPGEILANLTASPAAPLPTSVSDAFDYIFSSSEGDMLFRGVAGWQALAAGTSGRYLKTSGPGGDPTWADPSLPFNGSQIFVSDTFGLDTNSGSYENPVQTIAAAQTIGSSLLTPYSINVIDSATYTGSVTFSDARMAAFYAGSALFTSTTGDVFTVSTTGSQHIIDVGLAQRTSTYNVLKVTGTSAVSIRGGAILGPMETNNAQILVNVVSYLGNATVTGSGAIAGTCTARSGTNTGPNINILTPDATTFSSFKIGALTYTGTDSTSGDVLTTDGAGNLTLQAPGGGGGTNQSSITLSPTVFTYFNQILTGSVLWVSASAPNTQGAFSAGATNDYGTFTFKAAAGTYNCCVLYPQGTGNGIMRLIFNGGTPTDIDQYGTAVNQYVSYQFSVTLVEGDNTINLLTNGKNGSSSNYYLALADSIILNRTGP